MKSLLFLFSLTVVVNTKCVAQGYLDTTQILNRYTNQYPEGAEQECMVIMVKLISLSTGQPIANGKVSCNSSSKGTNECSTDADGNGVLKPIKGVYKLTATSDAYQKKTSAPLGPESDSIVMEMRPIDSFRLECEFLKSLAVTSVNEAIEYLNKLKLKYPNNNDLTYYQRKYKLE